MFLTFNQIFDKKYFCIFLRFNTKNSNFKNCVNTKNSNFNLRFTWAIFDTFNLKEDILDRPPNKTDCVGCIDQIFSQSNTLEYDIFFRWLLKRADVALSNFSAAFSSRNLKVFFFLMLDNMAHREVSLIKLNKEELVKIKFDYQGKCNGVSQPTFQRRINFVSTLWMNVKKTLIRRWKWSKIQHQIFNVAQRWCNVGARRWNNIETTLCRHCFSAASTLLKLDWNQLGYW